MSKEKQIEEMARTVCKRKSCDVCYNQFDCIYIADARCLYNAGYRKQSEPISCGHEKGGDWISVEERLPEVDTNVLVITASGSFKVARCNIYKNETLVLWATNDGLGERAITHWMPLPEPPKGE